MRALLFDGLAIAVTALSVWSSRFAVASVPADTQRHSDGAESRDRCARPAAEPAPAPVVDVPDDLREGRIEVWVELW
ncbi:hypothetical protein [Nocardia cyriacigeorgica]|uniref:hypothetical protein n=1 Tax=Nocardia cyriacigeorgica TaxID=135487 RepID=UPI00189632F8|nr:hypothetical protein [Nocardia cyriacigeorgica]MBF6090622.1 hypothetical protein [Nocardia cyriacigeorgica]